MTAQRLADIETYYFAQKLHAIKAMHNRGKRIINLGIGNTDRPPHPDVIKALQETVDHKQAHAYQDYKGIFSLREAFVSWYDNRYQVTLDPETEVLPLMGSKEGIMHICMTYLNENDEALIPNPGYPVYGNAIKLAGGRPVSYPLKAENNWLPDMEALAGSDLSKVKLMFVNYPHMPTGKQATTGLFSGLVHFAKKHGILLVHDNPYSFILNDKPLSLFNIAGAKETGLELNSLSKSHNMAGWRLGVLCGAAERIEEVFRFKSNMDSGMFLPLQMAAVKALRLGDDWYDQLNALYVARRQKAALLFDALGCTYTTDQVGMFLWGRVPPQYSDGYDLSDELLYRAGIFLTPGGVFGSEGKNYVRLSLTGSTEQLDEAIERVSNMQNKNLMTRL